MGLMEMFTPEEKVTLTYSEFYQLVKEATKAEMLFNGVKCKVSRDVMYAMATGEEPEESLEGKQMIIIGSIEKEKKEEEPKSTVQRAELIKNDESTKGDCYGGKIADTNGTNDTEG
ncbi:MAG: hypothetical protein IJH82_07625 [Lachnospiraceae bacterium]|nr:hypothetical protein [Lachnospiraceae bacterium]